MKKKVVLALGLVLVLVVVLAAVFTPSVLRLEDITWTLATVQDRDGNVIACGPEDISHYPGTEELFLQCSAQSGTLSLICGEKKFVGTYRQTQRNPNERIYEMEVQGLGQGYAVCAYTEFDTGERIPTLVITFPKDRTFTFTGPNK